MAGLGKLIGQVLDGKYQLDRLLGQGGMGAVFLATHLGTKRPVALKVIAPQFMANEEVGERFRREAEAAGRLRHPNVVNVTDFGLAPVGRDRIAYLVMEYLDGCSLGDMLKKKGRLSLSFTVDVVEQICLAIGNAHQQGIIHRDLKPDNVWLQPDRRGGYIVKVLDFGLAKLRDTTAADSPEESTQPRSFDAQTRAITARPADTVRAVALTTAQQLEAEGRDTVARPQSRATVDLETATRMQATAEEEKTAIFDTADRTNPEAATRIQSIASQDDDLETATRIQTAASEVEDVDGATRIHPDSLDDKVTPASHLAASAQATSGSRSSGGLTVTSSSAVELTRIGSVLGTPLYMSPEQCRSEALDARSDIYSLGVIVYQMLAGETPFKGSMTELIASHTDEPPPPLGDSRIDVPKSVAALVMSALAKDPAERPATAESFAAALRATAEGEAELLRQSKAYYYTSQRVFLGVSALVYLPFAIFALLLSIVGSLVIPFHRVPVTAGFYLSIFLLALFATKLNTAACTLAMRELRKNAAAKVNLKAVLKSLAARLPTLATATALHYARVLVGLIKLVIPGVREYVRSALFPSVIALEGERPARALERSRQLVAPLGPVAAALQAREFGITLGSLIFFPFITVLMALIFGGSGQDSFNALTLPLMRNFIVGYCWFLLLMMHTVYAAMPIASLYFKARQAQGEVEDETERGDFEQEEKRGRPARMSRATLAWFVLPLVMLLFIVAFPVFNGSESLIESVRKGRQNAVKKMLSGGASPNVARVGGTTALMYAAKDGQTEIAKALLDAGADLRAKDGTGDDALMYAANDGRTEVARVLLAAGTDVNAQNNAKETALIAAARRGRSETVQALIAGGADVNAQDEKGKTALSYAEEEGHAETARLLKAAGASQ